MSYDDDVLNAAHSRDWAVWLESHLRDERVKFVTEIERALEGTAMVIAETRSEIFTAIAELRRELREVRDAYEKLRNLDAAQRATRIDTLPLN